jgi:hypothetical protein
MNFSLKEYNFVGAARRELQEGGFAVEPSLLAGCGLKAHDSDPSEAWTSFNHNLTMAVTVKFEAALRLSG